MKSNITGNEIDAQNGVYVKRKAHFNIAGIGLPGAGKGTTAQYLKQDYSMNSISTGDLLRWHVERETEIGKKAKTYMDAGELVPDEIIVKLYSDELLKPEFKHGHFGDGTGRTLKQYKSYEKAFGEDFYDGAIFFNLPPEVVRKRLLGRVTCNECSTPYSEKLDGVKVGDPCPARNCKGILIQRNDDRPEKIEKRISEFEKNSPEYLEHLRRKGILWEIPITADMKKFEVTAAVGEAAIEVATVKFRKMSTAPFYSTGPANSFKLNPNLQGTILGKLLENRNIDGKSS